MRSPSWSSLFFLILLSLLQIHCKSGKENSSGKIAFTLPEDQLPVYEKEIDHKALIQTAMSAGEESLKAGHYIYNKTCFTCHGDPLQQGSIPVSLKFWEGKFKVGNDPYSMYQTLTRGFGSMPPQVQLTPVEKYNVIHYIRTEFIAQQNPGQLFPVNDEYLASLPKGTSQGPEPSEQKPWAEADYGNFLINTYELAGKDARPRERSEGKAPLPDENLLNNNFAYKGIAIRLDSGKGGVAAGHAWTIFDHDLMRVAGAWTGDGFIDWEAILFNGTHNISPRTVGDLQFENPVAPGWANPAKGNWTDTRFKAVDGRRFGPLPRNWTRYKGLYQHEGKTIISYSVGATPVLEMFGLRKTREGKPVFTRSISTGKAATSLKMRVAPDHVSVALAGKGASLKKADGFTYLIVPPSGSLNITLLMASVPREELESLARSEQTTDLSIYTHGGKAQYPETVRTIIHEGKQEGPFQVDVLTPPFDSPWKNQLRLSGIDFPQDRTKAYICSTDGDVWQVDGITQASGYLTWHRIASGLFQPLGIKVVNGRIYVTCRDQLVRLNDLNGDGETDFYESFNSDHQVTNHFHEFAMGLQTDKEGNFYYAKSARHARRALVPQHGTLLKVSKDGQSTEIVAKGFRAANGVCINPDGTFIVTDQEGHWNPMNRINWVKKGGFYGNMFGYDPPADSSDEGMEPPLVWVERHLDQSPSELLWVESEKWGPLNGGLLDLSYGYGKLLGVLVDKADTRMQGGVYELPVPRLSTGIMRGRFNPADGQLYACGLSAWGSTQAELGGFYRIRYVDGQASLPVKLHTNQNGVEIIFTEELEESSVLNVASYKIETWDLKRSRSYGSDHYNVKTLTVSAARWDATTKKLTLTIPDIKPTWVMEITYELKDRKGKPVKGLIQNTIYELSKTKS